MNKIKSYLKDEYWRNIFLNYIFKIAALLLGLITVNVNIGYLGNTLYGLWVTIASVISWMSSGDFGIANGLRNELAKAFAEKDNEKQQKLIATAFFTLSKIAVILFAVIIILCEIFFKTGILQAEVRIPMYITALFFCLNLCIGICQSVAYSYQKSFLTSMVSCSMTLLSIVLVVIVTVLGVKADLTIFAILHGFATLIPNIILIFILKRYNVNFFRIIKSSNNKPELKKSILNVGLQFFGLQLCSVVLYSTDSLLINYLIDSEMVTKYSIITKVYDSGNMLFSILLIALWSAVTVHITQKDFSWVTKKIKELLLIWSGFAVGVVLVSLLFNQIVTIWLGDKAFYYEPSLVTLFGLYCVITAFSAIFVNVLNGAGVIKLQLIIAILGAVLNIPLSVIFAKYCGMGIFGVKLATFIAALMIAVAMPIQVVLYLKNAKNLNKES